ncbi:MAG: PrpF protein [Rhodospirillaceae bacterium]|nr:PrpF protein [Rhodospirillaceae bacterium]
MTTSDVHFLGLTPRVLHGVLEIPVFHMRGGTSTGIVLYDKHLPTALDLREEVIRRIMGVPVTGEASGNRQITGLGRGIPQSNKVFIVGASSRDDADIDSTLAQLAADKSAIDWSVNCGNMSSALPTFAYEIGLIDPEPGVHRVRIFNTNTGVVVHALTEIPAGDAAQAADTEIPGVMGQWPGVQLALLEPVGAKTGALLPTGAAADTIDGLEVSCVDLAVPMVIIRAADLGCDASEAPDALDSDGALKERLQRIWVEAGTRMGLKDKDGALLSEAALAASETVPKVCIIAPPSAEEAGRGANIRVRYFTPQACHKSLAVTGGACLAAACLTPGTVAHEMVDGVGALGAEEADHIVRMANPAGLLKATIRGAIKGDVITMPSAAYERSTQILLRGHTPLYNASSALLDYYRTFAKAA